MKKATVRVIIVTMSTERKSEKNNVMRLLETAGINFRTQSYEYDENDLSGTHVAKTIGMPEEQVFKTLVTRAASGGFRVFCIPVCCELDLKKAARISGDKSVSMIAVKELLPITGYIRGGCSPVGMKKPFPTVIDETALLWDEIAVSAGKRGLQVILDPRDLISYISAVSADICL